MTQQLAGFDDVFRVILGHEGALSVDPDDPGNWTGGRPGKGIMKGTKYGISAKSYPDIDIAGLTLEQAKTIAKRDYWDKYQCGQLPVLIAFQLMDTAYNGGKPVEWLQRALGVPVDGKIGAVTIGAARAVEPLVFAVKFNRLRLDYMRSLGIWRNNSSGWASRIFANIERALP